MHNNSTMLNLCRTPKRSMLSLPVFPVRTYQYLIKQAKKASEAPAADYGERWRGLRVKLCLNIWFLKTLRSYSNKDLNMSYQTFPRSGMMQNGIVGELQTLGTPITVKDSTLLPTPVASDGGVGYSDHQALLNYYKRGHQRRLIYECQLAGLKDSETLELYREIMSFPISLARLKRSETQLCLW